jgi:DNA-binding transcriptional regulator YhcF (GntR family)
MEGEEVKEIEVSGDRRMTVREVADALGVSENTVRRSLNSVFPDLAKNGKVTLLTEAQVTAVKMNLRKNSQVAAQPQTELEMMLKVQEGYPMAFRRSGPTKRAGSRVETQGGYAG